MNRATIKSEEFIQRLIDSGVVPDLTTHVVIDALVDYPVYIHYKVIGDDRLLDLGITDADVTDVGVGLRQVGSDTDIA